MPGPPQVGVGLGVTMGVLVRVGVEVTLPQGTLGMSQRAALTINLPQSPLCVDCEPT